MAKVIYIFISLIISMGDFKDERKNTIEMNGKKMEKHVR